MKTLGTLTVILLALLVSAGAVAAADEGDAATTGELRLTLVDASGALVSGACFELYAPDGLFDTFCNTTGTSSRTLPEGQYVLREVHPPQLRLPQDAPSETHVYRRAPERTFAISALLPAHVTIEHEIGAVIEVHATLPDGQDAIGSCFAARGSGDSTDPDSAGPVVDEACTGSGATAKLFVAGGQYVVSQVTGSSGFAFARDARVTAVLDATVQIEMAMREAAVLRIEQRLTDGSLVGGGCYSIHSSPSDGAETFVKDVCDSHDEAGTDGILVADDLQPGRYRLHEEEPPEGYETNPEDSFVVLDRTDVTIVRTHARHPYVIVKTTDADSSAAVGGSCWRVRFPGDREGFVAEACDKDDGGNDGTTTLVVPAGQWELLHLIAPTGYTRLSGPTPFTVAEADVELSFALAGPQAPANVSPPTIAGTPSVGVTLMGDKGTWTGTTPITYHYQWLRCTADGNSCLPIATATQASYLTTPADFGARLRLTVTATNLKGGASAPSAPTALVGGDRPVNIEPPAIAGPAFLGALLVANEGWWAAAQPVEFGFQWERCDAAGASCVPIAGATTNTFRPGAADHHATLRVAVTASNAHGATVARSPVTAMLLAPPWNVVAPQVTGTSGGLFVGKTVLGRNGIWTGMQPIAYSPQWLRCDAAGESCAEIPAASDWPYTPAQADVGYTLRLQVTGSNVDGATAARSLPTLPVAASPPLNVAPPRITGDLRPLHVGGELEGEPGRWVGPAPIEYAPQWLRCDGAGEACVEIQGATDWSYTLSRDDLNHALRLRVTATNVSGSVAALSAATAVLEPWPPRNVELPSIRGVALVGNPLTGTAGRWVGLQPIEFAPQWLRCDLYDGSCDAIAGASAWTFVPTLAEGGHTIRLAVAATNADGTTTVRSWPTAVVPANPGPVNVALPVISSAHAIHVGGTLLGREGSWDGARPIAYAPRWVRCDENGELCVPIAGATGWSYVVVQDDVGHTLRLEVAATNALGTVSARSVRTPLLPPRPPLNVSPPRLSGSNQVGGVLVGHQGIWVGTGPIDYAPQWLRCDGAGEACVEIPGATTWQYLPTAVDGGLTVRLQVIATNVDGAGTARSPATRIR